MKEDGVLGRVEEGKIEGGKSEFLVKGDSYWMKIVCGVSEVVEK